MSVRILWDTEADLACLYCPTTEVVFGPLFHSTTEWSAQEQAEHFCQRLGRDARRLDEAELLAEHSTFLRLQEDGQLCPLCGWRELRVPNNAPRYCQECGDEYLAERDAAVDEAYERAAARARSNDFAETGGKDWT